MILYEIFLKVVVQGVYSLEGQENKKLDGKKVSSFISFLDKL